MNSMSLDPSLLMFVCNVAVAACVACLLGLLASRLARKRAIPLQHSVLVVAVGLTVVCPLLVSISGAFGIGLFSVSDGERSSSAAAIAPTNQEAPHEASWSPEGLASAPIVTEPMIELDTATTSVPSIGPEYSSDDRTADVAPHPHLTQLSRGGQIRNYAITFLATVWIVGLVVGFARLFRGLLLVGRMQRTLVRVTGPRLRQAARTAFQSMDLEHDDRVFESTRAPTPLTLGLFRSAVVLPAGFSESLDEDELRCVLIHEAAHIKRRDTWIGLLQRIAQCVFWWNPLLHLANRSVNRLRELICDDHVIAAHGDGEPLARAIVKVAEWSTADAALPCCSTLVNETEELSERIKRLTEKEHTVTLRLSWKTTNLVVLFALLLATVLFFPTLKAARAQAVKKKKDSTAPAASTSPKSKAPKEAKPKSKIDSRARFGQRHALEYATTILIFFDTNQDAHLSREESRKTGWPYAERVWFHGDSNRDNRVSRQELKDEYLAMYGRVAEKGQKQPHTFAEQNWARSDTNRDGRVDRKEARNSEWLPAEQIWFRGDLDKDDKLTVNELRVHYAIGALDKGIRMRAADAAAAKRQPAPVPPAVPNVKITVRAVETMILSHFDKDRDGALGRDEIRKMPWPRSEATFSYCDLNGDKKVTLNELSDVLDLVYRRSAKQRQEMPDRFAVHNWRQLDTNRDGVIDRAERTSKPHPHIEAWFKSDVNGDGRMILSEMNLAFTYIALDKSIRMKAAVEKRHAADGTSAKKPAAQPANHATRYSRMLLDRFDKNGNGSISRDESRKAPWPKSEEVWFGGDKNGDNHVTADELEAQFAAWQTKLKKLGQQQNPEHSAWIMKVVDRNEDGRIDWNETQLTSWPGAGNNWFKGDSNGDDLVSYEELILANVMNGLDGAARIAEAARKR